MTRRLYYDDSYLRRFTATVVARDGARVYLNQTAFYPTSGGQPFDCGALNGTAVLDVVDEGERVAHLLADPVAAEVVQCEIDWTRRFDHMQQHTGQHLLSAVFADAFGLRTVGFHLGAEVSTVDLETPSLPDDTLVTAERRANEWVQQNAPIVVEYRESDEAGELRKASSRQGTLRIVSIAGLDRNACGGTHVRATGEIGAVLLRRTEKVRGVMRVEFVCGQRAVTQARADQTALSQIARSLSVAWHDAPMAVAGALERARLAEKALQERGRELTELRAGQLWRDSQPDADGVRRMFRAAPGDSVPDEARHEATTFVALGRAIFVYLAEGGPAVLVAASADSGIHAGEVLKAVLSRYGGRGGGSAQMAQGKMPFEAFTDLRQALGFTA